MSSERKTLEQDRAQFEQGNVELANKRKAEELQYQKDLAEYNKFIGLQKAEEEKQKIELQKQEEIKKAELDKQRAAQEIEDMENAKLSKEDLAAKRAINAAKTEFQRREAIWNYRETKYGRNLFNQVASAQAKQALAKREQMNDNNSRGSAMNKQTSLALHYFLGGTTQGWNERIARETQDRKTSQLQSAGLRAAGNAQIQAGIQAERERLANFTLVSPNIPQSRAPVAIGTVAQKAQDFGIGFTESTKQFGFIANKDTVSEPKTILTEAEQKAKAEGAFLKPPEPPTGIPKNVSNEIIYSRTGSGSQSDPFKGKQPDKSLVPNFMQTTYEVENVNPRTKEKFPMLTFKTKELAEKYLQRTAKLESSYIGFSPEGKAIQGAPDLMPRSSGFAGQISNVKIISTPYTETVSVPVGTLEFMIRTNQLTPNPKAKGYVPQIQGPQRPKPLSSTGERFETILKNIDEQQKKYAKYGDDPGILLHAGLEFGKDVIAGGAYVENLLWEGEAFVRQGERKTRDIQIPPTAFSSGLEGTLTGGPSGAYTSLSQYEKTYGRGSVVGGFAALVAPLPTGKLQTPKIIVKAGRFVEGRLKLAEKYDVLVGNPKTYTKGKFVKGQWVYPKQIGTRQERRIDLAKWEALTPKTQQFILEKQERARRLGPYWKEIEETEEIERFGFGKPQRATPTIPKITGEVIIRSPPRILTTTQGQPYNLDRDFGVTDLPRMGSKPDLRRGTSIDYKKLFEDDIPDRPYHAFLGESKSIGGQFQGTNINLGTGIGFETSGRSVSSSTKFFPPTTKTVRPKPDEGRIITGKGGLQLLLKEPELIKPKPIKFKVYPIRLEGEIKQIKITPKKKKKPETIYTPVFVPLSKIGYSTEYTTIAYPPGTALATSTILITEPKLDTRLDTKLDARLDSKLKTRLDTRVDTRLKTRLDSRLDTKLKTKLDTKLKQREEEAYAFKVVPIQKLRQPEIEVPKLKTILLEAPKIAPPLVPPVFFPPPPKPPREPPRPPRRLLGIPAEKKLKFIPKKTTPGEKADFLGNVSESQISGIFKRTETVYGQKKINRLLAGDVRVVKGKKRNVRRTTLKWSEGKKGDVFGFKYEKKKKNVLKF